MDSPVRQYLKQKDYRRHKLFRKMKRRRAAALQLAIDAPIKEMKRRIRLKRFDPGKDKEDYYYETQNTDSGMTYRIHPSAIGSKNLEVTLPEVKVTAPRKYEYRSAYHSEDVPAFFNILTGNVLGRLSPTQTGRAVYDSFNSNLTTEQKLNSWLLGNNGVVSDKFAEEHPYLSMATNLTGDAISLGGLYGINRFNALRHKNYKSYPRIIETNNNTVVNMTPEQWTAAQDAAIARGDMTEAQRLRDLHFKVSAPNNKAIDKQGNPIKTYHTVSDSYPADFVEFDPNIEGTHSAIYASDSHILSGTYTNKLISEAEREYYIQQAINNLKESIKNGHIDDYHAKVVKEALQTDETARKYVLDQAKWLNTKPMPLRQKQLYIKLNNPLEIEGHGKNWSNLPIHELPKDVYDNLRSTFMNGYTTRDIERAQMLTGKYDGGIIKNIYDYGSSKKSAMIDKKPATVYQINRPNQVKLADAVTFDNNGIRIPLGERDNFNIKDLRYGIIPAGVLTTIESQFNSGKDSGIHIKPENRGKFNALKKRTGKTTEQLTHSKNPLTRKRAIFALNARKWHKKK